MAAREAPLTRSGGSRANAELADELAALARDARTRTLETIADLDDEQLVGPRLSIVNPPLWEIGHVGWFWEFFVLRWRGEGEPRASRLEGADPLYNSIAIGHDERWTAALRSRRDTLSYLRDVLDDVLLALAREGAHDQLAYFIRLAAFHEDMHGEAFLWTRQTHGLPAPHLSTRDPALLDGQTEGPWPGDAPIPGAELMLGADPDQPFVFDNEKWAHPVELEPFQIARAPVTNAEFATFVEDGGYRRRDLWGEEGWDWRHDAGADLPVYWRRRGEGEFEQRRFDRWQALPPHEPVVHVCWHEADAYCRWAQRRLPTEAEWELAAAGAPSGPAPGAPLAPAKRLRPWGEEPLGPEHANLDGRLLGPADVAAFPAGDSAFGCRQMLGNVWEHCASDFLPYPGYEVDPYKEYSDPWFGPEHKILRGGAWPTRGRMLRTTWRNWGQKHRRDLFAGLRTCALD